MPQTRFTAKQVREIRKLYKEGWKQAKIAARLGVSQPAISYLLRGKTYKKVA